MGWLPRMVLYGDILRSTNCGWRSGSPHDDSIVANIFIGIGTSPLVLTIDGLVHEGYARSYQRIQTPTNMAFSKVECTKARPLHAPR
jgi:hypothetical protein